MLNKKKDTRYFSFEIYLINSDGCHDHKTQINAKVLSSLIYKVNVSVRHKSSLKSAFENLLISDHTACKTKTYV